MAAPTTTLADVLIEAGFEPEMARRVTEVIEQDLTGLARQAELDIRLDKIDDRFDRFEVEINGRFDVIDARLDGVDKELKATNQRIDDLKDSQERIFAEHKASVDRSLADQTAGIERLLAAYTESQDRSLADTKESIERLLAAQKESQDRSLADHKESIERLFAAHRESQDRSLNDHKESQASDSRVIKWALGILAAAVLGGGAAVIGLLIELFSRLP